ncbi:transmembrane protein 26 [Hermetia illucens]|nr:transmembrane protein 26 [Hermetia illucens]
MEQRMNIGKYAVNITLGNVEANLRQLNQLFGVNLDVPRIKLDPKMWITLIEQFLMLILIIGRWLLPKGDLTRDQLSQLLLVYIGTAADIIEFFDSYKDESISNVPLLVLLTLGIWSWSLMQFTIVLSATRARKPRGGSTSNQDETNDCCNGCCCGIDVWGIVLNVILQDAPFLAFRLLIIVHYKIINYMNVFFTCKNTLVILLQLYRLYVVNTEHCKSSRKIKKSKPKKTKKAKKKCDSDYEDISENIYIISGKYDKRKNKRARDDSDVEAGTKVKSRKDRRTRKDTGYSTASSQNTTVKVKNEKQKQGKKSKSKPSKKSSSSESSSEVEIKKDKKDKKKQSSKEKHFEAVTEESNSSETSSESEIVEKKKTKKSKSKRARASSSSSSSSSSS